MIETTTVRPASHRGYSCQIIRSLLAIAVLAMLASTPLSAKTLVSAPRAARKTSIPASTPPALRSTPSARSTAASSTSSAAPPRSMPGLAEKWDISPDGTVYTFHLRHGVKWQSNANFTPTRDFNADDIIFSFDRQWKTGQSLLQGDQLDTIRYFNDMGMPKLLKSVDKVDDYTVKIHAQRAGSAVPRRSGHGICRRSSRRNMPTRCSRRARRKKSTRSRSAPAPSCWCSYQKDAIIRYKAFPHYCGGKAKIDDLIFAITPDASVRWAKLKTERMPGHALSESGRPRRRSARTRT